MANGTAARLKQLRGWRAMLAYPIFVAVILRHILETFHWVQLVVDLQKLEAVKWLVATSKYPGFTLLTILAGFTWIGWLVLTADGQAARSEGIPDREHVENKRLTYELNDQDIRVLQLLEDNYPRSFIPANVAEGLQMGKEEARVSLEKLTRSGNGMMELFGKVGDCRSEYRITRKGRRTLKARMRD